MDDGAVLGFQVEYHSLVSEEDQEVIVTQLNKGKLPDDALQQEKLLPTELYETDEHIRTMLQKIFNRRSVVKKFKVKNGFPTMSAILTTHSIAQAKHIYRILKEMKDNGTLLNGRQFDERHQLIDKDFPRVAITFSTNPDQLEKNEQDDELVEIMKEYAKQFDASPYQDEKLYNQNINKRLARKEKQYQSVTHARSGRAPGSTGRCTTTQHGHETQESRHGTPWIDRGGKSVGCHDIYCAWMAPAHAGPMAHDSDHRSEAGFFCILFRIQCLQVFLDAVEHAQCLAQLVVFDPAGGVLAQLARDQLHVVDDHARLFGDVEPPCATVARIGPALDETRRRSEEHTSELQSP